MVRVGHLAISFTAMPEFVNDHGNYREAATLDQFDQCSIKPLLSLLVPKYMKWTSPVQNVFQVEDGWIIVVIIVESGALERLQICVKLLACPMLKADSNKAQISLPHVGFVVAGMVTGLVNVKPVMHWSRALDSRVSQVG